MTRDYDFIGFTYGGEHSIDKFGIYRTSDGSRYNDNIIPQLTDKTADIPGGDGQYYFYSTYKPKTFSISIAFDSLSDKQYQQVRQWLNGKEIKELVFDEAPYKVYSAKVSGTPQLKTICFIESGKRIYKGEGTIQFTCYHPFAHTPVTTKNGKDGRSLDSYLLNSYPTRAEWELSSGLQKHEDGLNYGDLPAPFLIKFNNNIVLKEGDRVVVGEMQIRVLENITEGIWDSKTGLVTGIKNKKRKAVRYSGTSYGTLPTTPDGKVIPIYYETLEATDIVKYYVNGTKEKNGKYVGKVTPPFTIEYNYWYY